MRRVFAAVAEAPTLLVLEVVLAAGLTLLAITGLRQVGRERKAVENWRNQRAVSDDYRAGAGAVLTSLSGIAADGSGVEFVSLPHDAARYVAFVLHGASLRRDLAFWGGVSRQLPRGGEVKLIGYCDTSECVRDFASGAARADFAVIGYTEYHTARVLLRADGDHRALVFDAGLRCLVSVPWAAGGQPAAAAAAIEGAR